MAREKAKIIVGTRPTESDENRLKEAAKAKDTTAYQLVRKLIYDYLNQNSQAA
jgi:hypothetical protein